MPVGHGLRAAFASSTRPLQISVCRWNQWANCSSPPGRLAASHVKSQSSILSRIVAVQPSIRGGNVPAGDRVVDPRGRIFERPADRRFLTFLAADHEQVFGAVVGTQRSQQVEAALARRVGGKAVGRGQTGNQLARVDVVGEEVDESPAKGAARQGGGAVGPDAQDFAPGVRLKRGGSRAVAAFGPNVSGQAAETGVDHLDRELFALARRGSETNTGQPGPGPFVAIDVGMDAAHRIQHQNTAALDITSQAPRPSRRPNTGGLRR